MLADMQGKVCVVTGASRGLGRRIALGLAEAGARVHISGRTVEDGHNPKGLRQSVAAAPKLTAK